MLAEAESDQASRVKDMIERIVRAELGEIVERVDTRFEDDFEGEPSVVTEIILTEAAPNDLGRYFGKTRGAVLAALKGMGETRFPYIFTIYPNDDYPEDDVKPRRPRA